jgi:outer membrane protein assembly factor BamB
MSMRACLTALLLSLTGVALASGENWPEFRGPTGDGKTTAKLPVTFSETENVVWKTPVEGKAWSSPIVWGNQIWLTNAFADGHKLYAVCLDAETGKVIKNLLVFEIAEPQFCIEYNSHASPTPAIEEGRVYVTFGAHGTACIDTKTFETLWTRQDLQCNHHRGAASSPILDGEHLILPFDGYDYQYVVALNKSDGKTAWKTDRAFDYGTTDGDAKKAYCTPQVIEREGKRMLICPAAVATEAFEPDTGKLLWTVYHEGMNASARPVYGNDLVYITNGMGKMVAVKPEGTGNITGDKVAWDSTKQVPKKASLILVDDLLFSISDNGVASCYDAKTGDVVWAERIQGEFDASPIYSDGRIYCFSKDGLIPVFKADRKFELLAKNKLDDGFMASPAVYKDSLILRSKSHVYRIGK